MTNNVVCFPDDTMASAAWEVARERVRQDDKWGRQDHAWEWWLAILGEEYGELCQAILETHFVDNPEHLTKGGINNIRAEAVQVCAVALAIIECIDRTTAKPEASNVRGN